VRGGGVGYAERVELVERANRVEGFSVGRVDGLNVEECMA